MAQVNSNGSVHNYGSTSSTGSMTMSENRDSEYTELLRGSVPCPSCRGVGSIPKEQESQLVALIPMRDKRLRPRKTYIWVGLAVLVTLIAAGLLIFFILPRSVDLTSNQPYLHPVGPVYINKTQELVNFTVLNRFNLTNHNYLEVAVTGVTVTVLYDTQVLATASNKTRRRVVMRGSSEYDVAIAITLDPANQMGYMVDSCTNPVRWAHEMVMIFQFTCNYEVLGHTEQSTLNTYQFVSCYSDVKPSTIAPLPTTKPPTTPRNITTTTTTTTTTPRNVTTTTKVVSVT